MDAPEGPRGIRDSISFWLAVVLAAAIVLPLPLVETLGFFGLIVYAASLAATPWLIDLLIVSLFLEAIYRRIPRILMAIPILAVGAYAVAYVHDAMQFRRVVAGLHISNPKLAIQLDPHVQPLVVPDAKEFVAEYALPAAYEAEPSLRREGYLAWRLLPPDQCAAVRKAAEILAPDRLVAHDGGCLFATPEQPSGNVVTVAVRRGTAGGTGDSAIKTVSIDVERDGRVVASNLIGISADRLPVIPWLYIGFVFAFGGYSGPPFRAELVRGTKEIGHVEDATDASFIVPVAATMLGLRRRPVGSAIPPAEGLDAVLARLAPKP